METCSIDNADASILLDLLKVERHIAVKDSPGEKLPEDLDKELGNVSKSILNQLLIKSKTICDIYFEKFFFCTIKNKFSFIQHNDSISF